MVSVVPALLTEKAVLIVKPKAVPFTVIPVTFDPTPPVPELPILYVEPVPLPDKVSVPL